MNKKVILSGILSLILCVSIITGGTLAIFTSESQTNIAINSGKVELVATLSDLTLYSPTTVTADGKIGDATNAAVGTSFGLGGTASITDSSIVLTNMMPGDKVEFNVNFKNNSNVDVSYRTAISAINDTGLFAGLKVTVDGKDFAGSDVTNWAKLPANTQPTPAQLHFVVELPVGAGNTYMDTAVELAVAVYAVQGNTELTDFETANEIIINTPSDLAYFSQLVNGGNTFKDKTVKLGADLDMTGIAYTPAGNVVSYPGITFAGTFDGQGHTISNLVTSAYGANGFASAGLFGSVTGKVMNVNLDKATITSSHYAGGIIGYSSNETVGGVVISNCKVTNSTITSAPELLANGSYDNGDKVGGIAGYIANNDTIDGCTVENVTLQGYRDIGGIVGFAHGVVKNNTVKDITLNVDKTHNYKNYTEDKEFDCNPVIGESSKTTVNENNTVDGKIYESEVVKVYTAAEFADYLNTAGVANAGNTVIELEADINLTDAWTPVNVDGYNGADIVTINGNNHTISGLTAPLFAGGFAGGSGIIIKDLTIQNSTMTSSNKVGAGAFVEYADSMDVVTLKNCKLINSSLNSTDPECRTGALVGYATGYAGTDGPVFANITIEDCVVKNCQISGGGSVGGIIGHAGANANTATVIKNCSVTNTTLTSSKVGDYRVGVVIGTANGGNVTLSGITNTGNTVTQANATTAKVNDLVGRFALNGTGTVTLDGTTIS